MKSQSRFSLLVAALAVVAFAPGCDEVQNIDPTPCVATAVQVVGANGDCEWVSSCDVSGQELCGTQPQSCEDLPTDACTIDSRCVLSGATACPGCLPGTDPALCTCTTTTVCETKPSEGCGDLDEATCLASTTCHPEYGWLDGTSSGSSGATEPGFGCTPEECGDIDLPAPPPAEWGFLGCNDNTTGPCDGLDVDTCESHPGCAPTWGGGDCLCEEGGNCACPDIAVYDGCIQVPSTCESYWTELDCESIAGCHWEYTHGDPEPVPCDCAIDDPNCGCSGARPAPADGTCMADYPVDSCETIYEVDVCLAVGCEWLESGGAPQPLPCECTPDEPDCICAEPEPAPSLGACVAPTRPHTCYDLYDPFTCESAGCTWYDQSTDPIPEPCDCPPDDPTCGCAGLIAPGYCGEGQIEPRGCFDYFDEFSCAANEICEWVGETGMVPPPCDCDPADPNCVCPDIAPAGYCQERMTTEPVCDGLSMERCELMEGCGWDDTASERPVPPCDCDPNDPLCECAGLIACDPESSRGADGVCYDPQGFETLDVCCEAKDPPACDIDSYRADDGICYDSTGVQTDDSCCEPISPPGACIAVP